MKKIIFIALILLVSLGTYLYLPHEKKFNTEYSEILETLHHYGKTPVEVTVYSDSESCSGLSDNSQMCSMLKGKIIKNDMVLLMYSRGTTESLLISGPAQLTDGFSTSFLYSSNDYTEETLVSDLKDAIKKAQTTQKQDRSSFHFCQKLTQAHWYICANEVK